MDKTSKPIGIEQIALNADQAAKALGISKRQLMQIKEAGEIPFVPVSRQTILFDPQDLRTWLAYRKHSPVE